MYLNGGALGEILLPGRYIPADVAPGRKLDVFIYLDSEDRLVATTETPHVMVGEFAYLKVLSVNPRIGAFLDWGLAKDLLLPFREKQENPVRPGEWVTAYAYLDERTQSHCRHHAVCSGTAHSPGNNLSRRPASELSYHGQNSSGLQCHLV